MCPSTYTEFIRRVYFRRGKEVVKIKKQFKKSTAHQNNSPENEFWDVAAFSRVVSYPSLKGAVCEDADPPLSSLRDLGVLSLGEHLEGGEMLFLTWLLFQFLCPALCQEQPVAAAENFLSKITKQLCLESSTELSSSCGLGLGLQTFPFVHLLGCVPLASTGVCAGALSLLVPRAQQHPLPCLASLSLPQGKEVEGRQMAFWRLDVTHIL